MMPLAALALLLVVPLTSVGARAADVSLSARLAQLEARAPALQAAGAQAAAQAGRRVAQGGGGYWGEVTLFGSDRHTDDPQLVEPIVPPVNINGMAFDDDIATYGLTARLPLDANGNLRAQVAAAPPVRIALPPPPRGRCRRGG